MVRVRVKVRLGLGLESGLKLVLGFALGSGLLEWDFSCMKIKFYCINEVIKVMVEKIGII